MGNVFLDLSKTPDYSMETNILFSRSQHGNGLAGLL